MNEVVVGIDIGSSKVCTIIGELNKKNQLQVLGVGTAECKGLKKGIIVDIDNTVEAIKSSMDQAERMSAMEIESVFINIAGGHANLIKNRGVIAVSGDDGEIIPEDIERVLQAVRVVNIPLDREIIAVIPQQFIVDGYEHIKDPVGMIGVRLEVEAYVVTAPTTFIQNLSRSIERCDIDVSGIVIDPLASSEVVLNKDEKEIGVALVDVGGEVTDISIFMNNNLVYTRLIPVGGNHITNDISIGLKIPVSEAESLKRQYGVAAVSMIRTVEEIPVNNIGLARTKKVTNMELADIIEARVQEICDLINKELEKSGYKGSVPGGVVITGGGLSFIKGCVESASSIIGLPVRIGAPPYIGVASPVYTTATGIVKYILYSHKSSIIDKYSIREGKKNGIAGMRKQTSEKGDKMITKIKDFFIDFF